MNNLELIKLLKTLVHLVQDTTNVLESHSENLWLKNDLTRIQKNLDDLIYEIIEQEAIIWAGNQYEDQ